MSFKRSRSHEIILLDSNPNISYAIEENYKKEKESKKKEIGNRKWTFYDIYVLTEYYKSSTVAINIGLCV